MSTFLPKMLTGSRSLQHLGVFLELEQVLDVCLSISGEAITPLVAVASICCQNIKRVAVLLIIVLLSPDLSESCIM